LHLCAEENEELRVQNEEGREAEADDLLSPLALFSLSF